MGRTCKRLCGRRLGDVMIRRGCVCAAGNLTLISSYSALFLSNNFQLKFFLFHFFSVTVYTEGAV
uniref:Uncharacterized protein n=1 Tax=Anguilla anguilla TaxID=7936 RepID=A0A0E9VSR0_ANGAN